MQIGLKHLRFQRSPQKGITGSNPVVSTSYIDKKKNKIKERIEELELELRESLTKKSSDTKEINVPLQQRKIQELKIQLSKM